VHSNGSVVGELRFGLRLECHDKLLCLVTDRRIILLAVLVSLLVMTLKPEVSRVSVVSVVRAVVRGLGFGNK